MYTHSHTHTHTEDRWPLRSKSTNMDAKHWPSRKGDTRSSRFNSFDSRVNSTQELTLEEEPTLH